MRRILCVTATTACLALAPGARAQSPTSTAAAARSSPDSTRCPYAECAFGLVPRLTGLDVVRGRGEVRVTSLGFFWPRDVRPAFAGRDSALHHATRAVRLRRAGAALTDLGGIVLALGAAQIARHGDARGTRAGLVIGGAALLGASVPAHFAADGELSRAVWWHNERLAR